MLTVINPATEDIITTIPSSDPEAIARSYHSAQHTQGAWAATPYRERARIIGDFRKLLERNCEEAAAVLSAEMGKPLLQAQGEIKATLGRIDWFLENTPRALAKETMRVQHPWTEEITYEPLGVIGNISAWNFPYFVGSNVFIPALLCGNAVLYKPSEYATLTGLKIAALLSDAGLPPGVFHCLVGGGEVGQALCALPLQGMFFTGSQGTGRTIAQQMATQFPRLVLELGGKDPAYICDDAAVQAAAEGVADGAFYNAGQSCCAVERIYVQSKVYKPFLEHFTSFTKTLVTGNPLDPQTYMGPLARKAQLEVLDQQISDALDKGAEYLVKGGPLPGKGYYFTPTVLVGVNHSMDLMTKESFGPVIGIQEVSGDEEALALMNDSDYGLTASVHTPDQERAKRLMAKLQAGTVYWNCCDRVSPYLPWSGRKASGLGSTLSHLGIQAFVQPKAWHFKHLS